MKRVYNCSRLKSAVLSALMVVSIKELDIEAVDCGRTVDVWHQEKHQKKLRTTFFCKFNNVFL
ncbi:hypothetical protein DPMN_046060 [Dreissena polymorpha]|uniref:Uncharacterized protein n=1 Tax=Dreissena polymorpha TaxID=45954 RepID=A0A9D3YT60_DREPO|nr:hypothetical protein DPMN_066266 [Dreissena polymorpha]KAH3739408.1 hypothetical protein DPMN_046060 [Dreissena polymorpha]